jgi:hypothetical protein
MIECSLLDFKLKIYDFLSSLKSFYWVQEDQRWYLKKNGYISNTYLKLNKNEIEFHTENKTYFAELDTEEKAKCEILKITDIATV